MCVLYHSPHHPSPSHFHIALPSVQYLCKDFLLLVFSHHTIAPPLSHQQLLVSLRRDRWPPPRLRVTSGWWAASTSVGVARSARPIVCHISSLTALLVWQSAAAALAHTPSSWRIGGAPSGPPFTVRPDGGAQGRTARALQEGRLIRTASGCAVGFSFSRATWV